MKFGSVCSGIEAASCAWHPLGWQAAWFSEIEKFPSAVLKHHYPAVPNRGDMTKFKDWDDATIDVLVGGTPCQSFSVAGLRKGLADPRGNLMLTYLAIAERYRPRWLVWENVPGVLSDQGNAFGAFLGGLGQLGYGFAYRVLDAQYCGVPQRRRRVFVVGCLGDWRRAAAVLFERASLRGDPAPSRKAGQRIAPAITAGAPNGSPGHGARSGSAKENNLIARPLLAGGNGINPLDENLLCMSSGQANAELAVDVSTTLTTLTTLHEAPIVAHALRGEGFDASEDGTGRGTPLVPMPFDTTQITSPQNRSRAEFGDPCHPLAAGAHPPAIAFSAKDHGADAMTDCAPTMRAGGHANSHANAGVMPAVMTGMQVRRLTPRECERLQGFPDDYTLIPGYNSRRTGEWGGNRGVADGPRYKALGNSMAVPVMRWIGERIALVDTTLAQQVAA